MNVLKNVLKGLSWFLLSILAFTVCTYLILLAFNMKDSQISTAAARLQQYNNVRMQANNEDNAYIYAMGFTASKDEDPLAFGKKRVEEINQRYATKPDSLLDKVSSPQNNLLLSSELQQLTDACKVQGDKCLEALKVKAQVLPQLLVQQQWLLQRYQTLLTFKNWHESVPMSAVVPTPDYSLIARAHTLQMVQTWSLASQQQATAVNQQLTADIHFWRESLANADSLLSKLVITNIIKNHFGWANLILKQLSSDKIANATPQIWSIPLTEKERSILPALAGEWSFFNNMLMVDATAIKGNMSVMSRLFESLSRPLLQPQESANRYAEMLLTVNEVLQVPYSQLPSAVAHLKNTLPKASAGFALTVYNPLGELLLTTDSIGRLAEHGESVADIEGIRRMSVMLMAFRSRALSTQEVAKQLQQTHVHNPYNNQSFSWDIQRQGVVFQGLSSPDYLLIY
jgi:hypothetical protein